MPQDADKEIRFFRLREQPKYDEGVSETVLKLAKFSDLSPSSLILDAGCGWGYWGRKFASQNHPVVGIDLILNPIEDMPNLTFVRGDLKHLPFGDRSFDVIFCAEVLHHFPTYGEVELVLEQLSRCLKRNGRIIIVEPNGSNPVMKLSRMLGKIAVKHLSAEFATINEEVHSHKEYLTALEKAHFTEITVLPYQEKAAASHCLGVLTSLLTQIRGILFSLIWRLPFSAVKGSNLVITATLSERNKKNNANSQD